ncbi:InlB B-repeat-containing protein [Bifidobacterium sp. SO1]|uniref:InlB B-repeat-containing protein n=1 Tax=Bifidobacterium sp. SO1 TaxID=2809029 RepID=UPI001BDBF5B8|nr:InlB B-repeat-containing protein [Bifidobacterium sp. SO1]MBT1162559.1 InlB B-repeat-containing protein [Bifidobacterium sp. SO1]
MRRTAATLITIPLIAAMPLGLAATANAAPDTGQTTSVTDSTRQTTSTTINLSTIGSKDTDKNRTQQSFQFENADWTGYYIRPGIKAKFKLTLTTDAARPNVTWVHRQVGRVDENNYAQVRAVDGGILKAGVNEIEYDTSNRLVGQVLYIRNDGGDKATVTVENENGSDGKPSLGRYPIYEYDPADPAAFWQYLQELRDYVTKGVDTKAGELNTNPALGMDATAITVGRMVYELRAAKLVDVLKDITTEQQAVDWINNVYKVSTDRLAYFDQVLGFDADDTDVKQQPTRMKIVLELTQNLTNPSTMFAWFTMYHLPESVFPGVATSVDGTHGWGNDHEFGHMLDIAPLTRAEETNNLISMWGRRNAGLVKMVDGSKFATGVYHTGVLTAQKQLTQYVNDRLSNPNVESKWGDIWYDVTARFNTLHWFDQYDYSNYDYGNGSGYTRELAQQVNKYGGLGAVYRQVRRNPGKYNNIGGVYDAAARAYSDALGFDMSEVMGRYGMTVTDATKEYTSKYPKLSNRVELYSIDADVKEINGASLFDKKTSAPSLTTSRNTDGNLTVKAAYPSGSKEAATVSGYMLLKDGKEIAWSIDGTFTVDTPKQLPEYTVVAYDSRINPSPAATVKTTADVNIQVAATDKSNVDKTTVRVTPDDTRKQPYDVKLSYGKATLKNLPPSTITILLDGYTTTPKTVHVDTLDWTGGSLQFTLSPTDGKSASAALRPIVHGVKADDGSLAFAITDQNINSDIYYTLDGSEPSVDNGIRYTGGSIPITSSPLTVRAIAYKAGRLPSRIGSATFTDSRQVAVHDQIYGPDYGVGNKVMFNVGTYNGAGQLGKIYEKVSSLNVPAGLKITLYEGENLTGTSHVYTSKVNWVNGYGSFPIKSLKVETVKAPTATEAGLLSFDPGAGNVMGSMPITQMYQDVTVTIPDIKYTLSGKKPVGWSIDGWNSQPTNGYQPGDVISPTGKNIMLTAQWAKNTYIIRFDSNGGTGSMSDVTANLDGKSTIPDASFTRTGYSFAGWRLADGRIIQPGEHDALTDKADDTVTLTAVWKANRHTIRFDKGNGNATGSMTDQTVDYGTTITIPANQYRLEGYTFAGWKDQTGKTHLPDSRIKVTNDLTLTAVWKINEYTVKFEPGADKTTGTVTPVNVEHGQTVTLPDNKYARTGYSFTGWKDTAGTIRQPGDKITVTTGMTFTAQWKADEYTVKFENGSDKATGDTASITTTYGKTITLPDNGYTLTGHTFTGWKDMTGNIHKPGEQVTVTGSLTFTAIWEANQYKVSFDPGVKDTTGSMTPITGTYGGKLMIPSNAFQRVGYTFTGWKTSDNTMLQSGAEITVTDDLTLTAQWTPISYMIRFNKNADNATGSMDDLTATYDKELQLPANVFTRDGYTFTGWKTTNSTLYKNETTVRNLTATADTIIELDAQWEKTPIEPDDDQQPTTPEENQPENKPDNKPTPDDSKTETNDPNQEPASPNENHKSNKPTDSDSRKEETVSRKLVETGSAITLAAFSAIALTSLAVAVFVLKRC